MKRTAQFSIILGLGLLLWPPLAWLVQRWFDPTEPGVGWLVALLVVGLVVRSVGSGPAPADARSTRNAIRALAATALVRLVGQALAINVVGALALVVDVWAVAMVLRLNLRPWPVAPLPLAALFAFALPLESILQRVLGYPLRWISAVVAEGVLYPLYNGVTREGTLLVREGVALGVDLPCSGAQGLVLLCAGVAVAWSLRKAGAGWVLGVGAALVGALIANAARIVLLFVGVERGFPVMAAPLHDIVGLVALALGALVPLWVVTRWPRRVPAVPVPGQVTLRPALAYGFAAIAVAVSLVPGRPLDVSTSAPPHALPVSLGEWIGTPLPLSSEESGYFDQYGGAAHKVRYRDGLGPDLVALRVQTTAPLRHLHGPDRCLAGAGHTVTRLGVRAGNHPVVVWKSVDPDGHIWRVETLFVDAHGTTAATISEVVWRWIRAPKIPWMLVERIAPWSACEANPARCAAFETALHTALDLGV